MTLTAADVAEIMRLVEESSFDELTLEMDGRKLTLRRGAAVAPTNAASATRAASAAAAGDAAGRDAAARGAAGDAAARAPAVALLPGAPLASTQGGASPSRLASSPNNAPGASHAAGAAATDPNSQNVCSPLLGTCYRAPKPGAPPFVEVDSIVEEDSIVAIVEVMKLMNTVRAGVRGRVTEILVADGALVEYGEALLRVSKSSQ